MRGILIIIDGLADLPCKQLRGKTPLGAAEKPNLDYLASRGKLGYMYPIKENFAPESDTAVVSILGNDITGSYRGYFEAFGSGVEMKKGDLALRLNFATVDNLKSKRIIDRRAGRTLTTREASILAKALNARIKLPCKFIFKNTIQHRGILILKGGFSDNITNTDSTYHHAGKVVSSDKFKFSEALDEDENTHYTTNIVNQFIEKSFDVLNQHPVNLARKEKGLMPANIVLTRGASIDFPELRKFREWASIQYMPLEIGVTRASGMQVFSFPYPELKGYDVYENLYCGLRQACKFSAKTIKKQAKNYNYFYVHFKETDIPGHDNKPQIKKEMIEILDKKFFAFLKNFAEKNKVKVLVTADHSTPCSLKVHSADPVPVLLCDWLGKEERAFSEEEARKGKLGKIYGKDVLKLLI